jgi:hypothetical protein
MGSQRAREITRQIERLRDIENRTQYEFKRLKESIKFQGASDYEMKKASLFRENYIKEMEKYKGFANYEVFMNKLKSIQNPTQFYNFVSKNELMQDLTYQSDEFYTEEAFNTFISQFDIDIQGDMEVLEYMNAVQENHKNERTGYNELID